MTWKKTLAWWTGSLATFCGVLGGMGFGVLGFAWLTGMSVNEHLGDPWLILVLLLLMFLGSATCYLVLFSIWLVLSRALLGRDGLIDVAENTTFQQPADARELIPVQSPMRADVLSHAPSISRSHLR